MGEKNIRAKKSQQQDKEPLSLVVYFSLPEFFPCLFRLFSAPTNCPWVSEDVVVLALY